MRREIEDTIPEIETLTSNNVNTQASRVSDDNSSSSAVQEEYDLFQILSVVSSYFSSSDIPDLSYRKALDHIVSLDGINSGVISGFEKEPRYIREIMSVGSCNFQMFPMPEEVSDHEMSLFCDVLRRNSIVSLEEFELVDVFPWMTEGHANPVLENEIIIIPILSSCEISGALLFAIDKAMSPKWRKSICGFLRTFASLLSQFKTRVEMQSSIEAERKRYGIIIEDQLDFVNTFDYNCNITYANKAFCNYYGLGKEEVKGVSLLDLAPEGEREDILQKIQSLSPDCPILVNQSRKELPSGNILWQQWLNRGIFDKDGNLKEVVGVGRDITRTRQMEEELKTTIHTLQRTFEETINGMGKIIEIKDPYTAGHQQNVADLSFAIAQEWGIPEERADAVYFASLVHDIGKIQVPSEILNKPGKLDDVEFSLVKSHSRKGFEILSTVDFPWPVADIVLQHHERINGGGYPDGITGENIMAEAKIMGVADVVEAISSHRPYRSSLGIDRALEEIENYAGILYEEEVVRICLSLFREGNFTFRAGHNRTPSGGGFY